MPLKTFKEQRNHQAQLTLTGFRKGNSCLTNLISFYDQVTCLVDEEMVVDVPYLDFSKALILSLKAPFWTSPAVR